MCAYVCVRVCMHTCVSIHICETMEQKAGINAVQQHMRVWQPSRKDGNPSRSWENGRKLEAVLPYLSESKSKGTQV